MAAGAAVPAARIEAAAAAPTLEGGTRPDRNPFSPVVAPVRAAAPTGSPPPMTMAALPRFNLPPIEPIALSMGAAETGPGAPPSSGMMSPATASPADSPLRLTGVIYGDPAIAILRKGERRYYVRPGDPVGDLYVVQSISQRRVVLASSQGTLSLDLTGRL
jgi:hypothetical protein